MSGKGVCRTAPATPGLLTRQGSPLMTDPPPAKPTTSHSTVATTKPQENAKMRKTIFYFCVRNAKKLRINYLSKIYVCYLFGGLLGVLGLDLNLP